MPISKPSLVVCAGVLVLAFGFSALTPLYGQGPALPVGPDKPVLVINSPSEPVPVRDVDNATPQPFQVAVGPSGTVNVPSGKRLVIEYVSGRVNINAGCAVTIVVRTTLQNESVHHFFPVTAGISPLVPVFSHETRLYTDDSVSVFTEQGGGCTSISVIASLSGHLVDVP
jgi:hypothetical protein